MQLCGRNGEGLKSVRLDEIVLRVLESKPKLRYQTAGEFRTRVESLAAAVPLPTASVPSPADQAWQSPHSGWGHFIGYLFGIKFTS
jgi:hypothetical protein